MTPQVRPLSFADIGNFSLGTDGHPRGLTPKLGSVGEDSEQRFFMLATYCFDLTRKLKYLSLALKEFHWQGDPAFAKVILDDEAYINPDAKNLSWKEMAGRAEEVMQRLYREVQKAGRWEALEGLAASAESGAPELDQRVPARPLTITEIGNLSLGTDNHPRGLTPKLASVGEDSEQRFFMLATYCFDLTRKLKYLSLALKEFHWQGDPAFAKMILDDEAYINPDAKNLSWKEMAGRAEEVMQRLYREVQKAGRWEALEGLAASAESGAPELDRRVPARPLTITEIGNMSLGTDGHTRGLTPKLGSVGEDSEQRFFMLATYCFDLTRKLKYLSLALKEFHWQGDPAFAKMILDDEAYINPDAKNLSWKEMAGRAEEVMQRLYREVQKAGRWEALEGLAAQAESEEFNGEGSVASHAETGELVAHS